MGDFIVFLDEAGDHTLEIVDKDFPLFILVAFIVERDYYIREIIPNVIKAKYDFFNTVRSHFTFARYTKTARKFPGLDESRDKKEILSDHK